MDRRPQRTQDQMLCEADKRLSNFHLYASCPVDKPTTIGYAATPSAVHQGYVVVHIRTRILTLLHGAKSKWREYKTQITLLQFTLLEFFNNSIISASWFNFSLP